MTSAKREMSDAMQKYFSSIEQGVLIAYNTAREAKKLGYDPEEEVVPLAKNMAERIVGLISVVAPQIKQTNIIDRIAELEGKYGSQDWRVALEIAKETTENFLKFKDKRESIEIGLRVGLAYLTNGVVSSPLEGFTELKLKKRKDGKEYFSLYFSGPIRSAGTTAVCAFLALSDYLRKTFGYDQYDPTEDEIKRMVTELYDFHERITNLQYLPSSEEIEFLVRNLPVQIDGDPTEELEVSNYKDLKRIETNKLRNGPCLVVGEGIAQKAAKFYNKFSKWMDQYDMQGWNFLENFVKLQKKIRAKESKGGVINPDYAYIKDLVAGRPILTHPLAVGGFRLRYGRCRNSGFSSDAIHPSTMHILNNYIAIGTQLRTERPGKSSAIVSCDSIEGPIVKLKSGEVLFLDTEDKAKRHSSQVEEILFLGDILINYGDFLDRGHRLVPCGYNEEWYARELEILGSSDGLLLEIIKNPLRYVSGEDALTISTKFKVPLHPRYTYHWNDLNKKQLDDLVEWFGYASDKGGKLILPFSQNGAKRILELLGIPHLVSTDYVIVEGDDAYILNECLLKNLHKAKTTTKSAVLEVINDLFGIKVRDKSGTFIGARMGRPEKAKMRKLDGSPQVLFPVGKEGGRLRSFQSALEKGRVKAEFPIFYCDQCKKETIYPVCEDCNARTRQGYYCQRCKKVLSELCKQHRSVPYRLQEVDIQHYFNKALTKIDFKKYDGLLKGVRGTSNEEHIPENLVKGILRSVHGLYVNKDGTVRYDITELAITHFKPKEIGTSIKKLKAMGYEKDIYGGELEHGDQVIELKCQDVILPACEGGLEEGSEKVLSRLARFLDDLLVKLYGLKRFYNIKSEKDLVGHLVVALSPHTSAGVIARIIGFSKTQGFFAHPLLHSMCRRDVDGDELSITLLMDVLLNFSKKYLPSHRGATQDSPLVLNYKILPREVDDMVFNIDVGWKYPLEFYDACLEYREPREIKIEVFGKHLNTEKQYEGLGFTNDVSDINAGVRYSAYKSIPTMEEKVIGQMEIARKIRAVNETDVARLIIERHFIRDLKGNLRKFSAQQFRCVNCNEKYRRPPLIGRCLGCNGKIIFTVSEGTITKYLLPSLQLAEKYGVPLYTKQTLEITKQRIEEVFGKEDEKQEGLRRWFA